MSLPPPLPRPMPPTFMFGPYVLYPDRPDHRDKIELVLARLDRARRRWAHVPFARGRVREITARRTAILEILLGLREAWVYDDGSVRGPMREWIQDGWHWTYEGGD